MTREEVETIVLEKILTGYFVDPFKRAKKLLEVGKKESWELFLKEDREYFIKYFLDDPQMAYYFAYNIDSGPSDDTRGICCRDSHKAYLYARYVDKCASLDTWSAASRDEDIARLYAEWYCYK